ncbi:MAG: inositol monophosphatase [Pirellulaceae bacterium]|nr:inositol monophosphatase [Pirellulaceae bacterium]
MSEYLSIAVDAARAGGKAILALQNNCNYREKLPKDLVTNADFASQKAIYQVIQQAYPTHTLLGEEDKEEDKIEPHTKVEKSTSATKNFDPKYRWIVDPLDGTINYVHGLPPYAVSVALEVEGCITVGVVYDPTSDSLYSALLGEGATHNGHSLSVSDCQEMRTALVVASMRSSVQKESLEVRQFVEVLQKAQSMRRLGSAALNLCYLAAGQIDAYWAPSLKIWDVAAGFLILKEAGGVLSGLDGREVDYERPAFLAASTKVLHQAMFETLQNCP